MSLPLVSIIIPYYDCPAYFLETVGSLQKQTYSNFEVVVVDDCSPEPSARDILEAISLPGLQIIRHENNQGPQNARKTAVKASHGELIVPLDCDDMLHPTYLETVVAALDAPEIGAVYTQAELFGEETGIYAPQPTMIEIMCGGGVMNTFLYRRRVYDDVGGYNPNVYCSDASFWLSALSKGWQFKRVDAPLYRYRRRATGRWSRFDRNELVVNLLDEYGDLYHANLREILAHEESKYWRIVDQFKGLGDQYKQLEKQFQELGELFQQVERNCQRSAKANTDPVVN